MGFKFSPHALAQFMGPFGAIHLHLVTQSLLLLLCLRHFLLFFSCMFLTVLCLFCCYCFKLLLASPAPLKVRVCIVVSSYAVMNLFLAIIVICLNTFFFFSVCLTLNYHTLNLNFIHLHVTLMVFFEVNFLLRPITYHYIGVL